MKGRSIDWNLRLILISIVLMLIIFCSVRGILSAWEVFQRVGLI